MRKLWISLVVIANSTVAALAITNDCSERCTAMSFCTDECTEDGSGGTVWITCGQYGVCDPTLQRCPLDECRTCAREGRWNDADSDLVYDDLEHDLAHRFFPNLWLQHQVPDLEQAYPYLGQAIPYSVARYGDGLPFCTGENRCLEIRYGIAFRNDCGDFVFGPRDSCDTSGGPNDGHFGDSEFYAALVRTVGPWSAAQYDSNRWELIRDFTQAHADEDREGAYGYCLWNTHCYSTLPLTGPAKVHASEGKHALYHTDDECDNGGWWDNDDCPHDRYNLRNFIPGKLQNIGNKGKPSSDILIIHPDFCNQYNVWGRQRFGDTASYTSDFESTLNWALPWCWQPSCPICGNYECESGENSSNCAFDCGYCGDFECGAFEDHLNCPYDCGGGGSCGDGSCDVLQGECAETCPRDCTSGELCQW